MPDLDKRSANPGLFGFTGLPQDRHEVEARHSKADIRAILVNNQTLKSSFPQHRGKQNVVYCWSRTVTEAVQSSTTPSRR